MSDWNNPDSDEYYIEERTPQRRSTRYVVQRVSRRRQPPYILLAGALLAVPIIIGLGILGIIIFEYNNPASTPTPFVYVPPAITPQQPVGQAPEATPAAVLPTWTPTIAPTNTAPIPTTDATVTPALVEVASPTPTIAFVSIEPTLSFATSPIVYVCFIEEIDEICVMNADGSGQTQITYRGVTSFYPAYSPDYSEITFSSIARGGFDIFVMNADGSNIRQLTHNSSDEYAPDFSPNGSQIVYVSTAGEEGDQNIWIMNADGSNQRQLTFSTADDLDPTWSPGGDQISYASSRNGTKELFVINVDGSGIRQITYNTSIGGRNDWSPDGGFLTYYRGGLHDKNIYLVSTRCAQPGAEPNCRSEPIRVTTGGNNKGPSFSPDGQWITFAANRGADNDIWVIRVDGTNLRQLTYNSYAEWQPRWQP